MILTPTIILVVGLLLALKHWVVDGFLQTSYQYLNKGNLKHPGGYVHAGLHGLFTLVILQPWGFGWLAFLDMFVHFWVDWAKVNITKKCGWSGFGPNIDGRVCLQIYSDKYFYGLVGDQCLHFATYILLIFLMGWI